jgi:hypothetical protein
MRRNFLLGYTEIVNLLELGTNGLLIAPANGQANEYLAVVQSLLASSGRTVALKDGAKPVLH